MEHSTENPARLWMVVCYLAAFFSACFALGAVMP
jgi:hypothetical protein